MKKFYSALTALIVCILAAIPAALVAAAGGDGAVTIDANQSTGSLSGTGNYHGTWTSTQTSPQFTIKSGDGSVNNMQFGNGHILCFVGKNASGKTYTVAAGNTHYVSHVKLVIKDHNSNGAITIEMGGKKVTPSAEEQTLEADFTENAAATFKLDGSNTGLELVKCEITAKPKSNSGPSNPSTPITEETTFSINRADCETNGLNGNKSFCQTYTSSTNPVVTLASNGKANGGTSNNGYFDLRSGGTSITWTISVPDGYAITAVSFDYANNGSASTLECGGKTYTGADAAQAISMTGLSTTSVALKITESNKGVRISNLKVTVKPGQAADEPETGGYKAPAIPDELKVTTPEPVAFATTGAVNGSFPADAKWFVVALNGRSVPYKAGSDRITLNGETLDWTDSQLYCITGSESTGYTIYNKAAGPGMQLASPKTMTGDGKNTYAILKAPGDDSYSYLWDITPSDKISGKTGYFISQHGAPGNAMNNNAGQNILSFWTGGKDAGSTFLFYDKAPKAQTAEYLHAPYIFPNIGQAPYNVEYRIPAIGVVGGGQHKGRLVAFIDLRKSGGDISASSNTDLHYSYSDDGGVTWKHPDWMRDANGTPVSLCKQGERLEDPESIRDHSFSDPCCVADRESGEIIVMSCAGRPESGFGFWGSRYPGKYRQEIARWFSHDGGDTWTKTDYDLTERVYGELLAGAYDGQGIDGMFIGSGKIHQSRHVKVGKYWRLYAALSTQINGGRPTLNYVIYSDDFGRTWDLLGHDATKPAVSTNADEPKVEELPDGSVTLIARGNGGNRNYNIFTFTDVKGGYGSWGEVANRNILGQFINACNGEPLMVPAIQKSTGEKCYVLLQSIPFSGSRENVSIAYKKIGAPGEWDTPAKLGENWEGRYQVSYTSSTYSTMAQMPDGHIAFFFEESPWGRICGVFYNFTLSQITDGAYEYTPDTDGAISKALVGDYDALFESRKELFDALLASDCKYVGQLAPSTLNALKPLINEYYSTRSIETLKQIDKMISGTRDMIGIADGAVYRMVNTERGNQGATPYYMSLDDKNQLNATTTASDACDWTFVPTSPAGRGATHMEQFYIKHVKTGRYVCATGANETRIATAETTDEAAIYELITGADGKSALMCTTPTGGNRGLHLAGDNNRVVPWTNSGSPATYWYIAPDDVEKATVTGINGVETDNDAASAAPEQFFDIYGRRVNDDALRPGNLYISNKGRKFIAR
ncbi:MAG: glycoside hydrolase [Pseudoflavonifractor sp.]|nr:glycoside hydrolase [Alloprevotella sp.]MCM1117358.1 glycoside hydrolase [Pseudoflavonifractor sp.]